MFNKNMIKKLEEVQKRCSCRTITVEEVQNKLNEYFNELGISKKNMIGTIIKDCDLNAQSFPSAYKYTPESTHISAEYKSKGWVITDIWRGKTNAPSKVIISELSTTAKEALIEKYQVFC